MDKISNSSKLSPVSIFLMCEEFGLAILYYKLILVCEDGSLPAEYGTVGIMPHCKTWRKLDRLS